MTFELIKILDFLHYMYWTTKHYVLGRGLVPILRLPSTKTTVTTWWLFIL